MLTPGQPTLDLQARVVALASHPQWPNGWNPKHSVPPPSKRHGGGTLWNCSSLVDPEALDGVTIVRLTPLIGGPTLPAGVPNKVPQKQHPIEDFRDEVEVNSPQRSVHHEENSES